MSSADLATLAMLKHVWFTWMQPSQAAMTNRIVKSIHPSQQPTGQTSGTIHRVRRYRLRRPIEKRRMGPHPPVEAGTKPRHSGLAPPPSDDLLVLPSSTWLARAWAAATPSSRPQHSTLGVVACSGIGADYVRFSACSTRVELISRWCS